MSHAKFAPSAVERWLHCGYSIKMEPFYPESSSAASDEGTKQHAIGAMHLENDTDPSNPNLKIYVNAVRSVMDEGELFVERKVIIVPDLCEGTMDAGVLAPNIFYGFDYKNGKAAVHATDNGQLMLYGLGVVREFTLPKNFPMRLHIVQPNAAQGWPVKTWDTDVAHLLKFFEKVKRAIDEGLKENPKAVAGSWCFWCKAKIHCRAYLLSKGKPAPKLIPTIEHDVRHLEREMRSYAEKDD